jgi:hypothetical protein
MTLATEAPVELQPGLSYRVYSLADLEALATARGARAACVVPTPPSSFRDVAIELRNIDRKTLVARVAIGAAAGLLMLGAVLFVADLTDDVAPSKVARSEATTYAASVPIAAPPEAAAASPARAVTVAAPPAPIRPKRAPTEPSRRPSGAAKAPAEIFIP